jgi:hypothetical protein
MFVNYCMYTSVSGCCNKVIPMIVVLEHTEATQIKLMAFQLAYVSYARAEELFQHALFTVLGSFFLYFCKRTCFQNTRRVYLK